VPEPRIVFVLSPYQNAFFVELVEALRSALGTAGVGSQMTTEPSTHVVGDHDVFVLLPPHEYVALEGEAFVVDETVAARTIGMSAEQPHQGFFTGNARLGARLGAVIDFSRLAVDAYRRHGVDARHLPFGYVPAWDRYEPGARSAGGRRPTTEVLYLGNKQPRRLSMLAAAADPLVRHSARLLISDNDEPNTRGSPTFVTGDDKRRLLESTRLLVNIHQSDEPYFEWLRFVEAAHCGTAVLSEHSTAAEPFVEGEHFLGFGAGSLGRRLDEVLDDRPRLEEVAAAAFDVIRSMPLSESVEVLCATARERLAAPPPVALPARTRTAPIGRARTDPPAVASWRPSRRGRLRRTLGLGDDDRWVVVAPDGTSMSMAPDDVVRAAGGYRFTNVLAHGSGADGAPTLEGLWPWQPWRLLHGQHLGRVLIVDRDLHHAVFEWLHEPAFAGQPHLAVQLFAARHGIEGGHLARPAAAIDGRTVDPTQAIPPPLDERCRQLLR
jgi:hypothetical protein